MSDSDDDLDALFEEMANQRVAPVVTAETAAMPQEKKEESDAESKSIFNSIEDHSGKPIFNRLGEVVRLMHDSMRQLGFDKSLAEVASQLPDAQGRLTYVAELTEQAANKVLNATDEGMPAQDALAKNAKKMEQRWEDLFAGKISVEDFKILAKDTKVFAKEVSASTDAEKARLLDIMMAQDFQDLTGQLIKKVLLITQAVENSLAQILIDNAPAEIKEKVIELMQGPSVPKAALEQDDVDNLLDSLGF